MFQETEWQKIIPQQFWSGERDAFARTNLMKFFAEFADLFGESLPNVNKILVQKRVLKDMWQTEWVRWCVSQGVDVQVSESYFRFVFRKSYHCQPRMLKFGVTGKMKFIRWSLKLPFGQCGDCAYYNQTVQRVGDNVVQHSQVVGCEGTWG